MTQVPNPDPPGWYIREELTARDWTQRDLAGKTGLPPSVISAIVCGRHDINVKRAIVIGKVFGTGPEVWMNLQTAFDLWRAGYRSKL